MMMVVMLAARQCCRVWENGWRGRKVVPWRRSGAQRKRTPALATKLIAWAILMPASFARHGCARTGRRISARIGSGFSSQTLHGLQRRCDCILSWKRTAHVGMEPRKKIIYGGAEI